MINLLLKPFRNKLTLKLYKRLHPRDNHNHLSPRMCRSRPGSEEWLQPLLSFQFRLIRRRKTSEEKSKKGEEITKKEAGKQTTSGKRRGEWRRKCKYMQMRLVYVKNPQFLSQNLEHVVLSQDHMLGRERTDWLVIIIFPIFWSIRFGISRKSFLATGRCITIFSFNIPLINSLLSTPSYQLTLINSLLSTSILSTPSFHLCLFSCPVKMISAVRLQEAHHRLLQIQIKNSHWIFMNHQKIVVEPYSF